MKQVFLLCFSSLLANPAKNIRSSFKKQFWIFSFSGFFYFSFKVNGQMSPKIANSFRTVNWKGCPDMFFTQLLCFYLILSYNNYKKSWIMLYNKEKKQVGFNPECYNVSPFTLLTLFYNVEECDCISEQHRTGIGLRVINTTVENSRLDKALFQQFEVWRRREI